jgi:hypothetical protein
VKKTSSMKTDRRLHEPQVLRSLSTVSHRDIR